MSLSDWLVLGALACVLALAFRSIRTRKQKGKGCCGSCGACPGCAERKGSTPEKRV